jgi:ribosomal protein S15P/S13E
MVKFTAGGRKLLETIRKAVAACERDLASRIGATSVGSLRRALIAYCRTDEPATPARTRAKKAASRKR